jgi:hypothetical protein
MPSKQEETDFDIGPDIYCMVSWHANLQKLTATDIHQLANLLSPSVYTRSEASEKRPSMAGTLK